MNPSSEILYSQPNQMPMLAPTLAPTLAPMMSEMPPQNTCNINFPLIKAHMTDFQNYSQQYSQQHPIPLDKNINIGLLMDNNYYKLTNQLVDDVTSINMNKLKCMGNNDRNTICKAYDMSMQTQGSSQLDDLSNVLDKYTVPLQKLVSWINNTSTDYVRYCGGNTTQIDKLKKIINRLNIITNNVDSCPTINNANIGLFTTNSSSCISLCILLIVVIGLVVYKSK